jgi:Domain of Unknown Function (DUF928)
MSINHIFAFRLQIRLRRLSVAVALAVLTLLGIVLLSDYTLATTPSNVQVSQRPAPPRKPPPNQTRPGGGLDDSRLSCSGSNQAVTALVPVENPVFTIADHPTFLFYVPDDPKQIRFGEFSVFTADEIAQVYEIRFTLPQTPGIVSVSLPNLPEYALTQDQSYRWYFKLYCQNNSSSKSDLNVNGWVQRIAQTSERRHQIDIASSEIWYDALASLAKQLRAYPQDQALQDRWANLLRAIGLDKLIKVPLVGPVIQLND